MVTKYASPNGNGSGSDTHPMGLRTALESRGFDELLLRGGKYTGKFVSGLEGVTVRSAPGEWAIIDGNGLDATGDDTADTLQVFGGNCTFRDFEVMNSNQLRVIANNNNRDMERRGNGIALKEGAGNKLIGLSVHDNPTGIYAGVAARDTEVEGCLVYNNGLSVIGNRGHGHGIYVQNDGGAKFLFNNLVFNNFGFNIHAFADDSSLKNINAVGNIATGSGILYSEGDAGHADIFVGSGSQPAQNITIDDSCIFNRAGFDGGGIAAGYGAANLDLKARGNRVMGGISGVGLLNWNSVDVSGNTFFVTGKSGKNSDIATARRVNGSWSWNNNEYFDISSGHSFKFSRGDDADWQTYAQWKAASGFDASSTYSNSRPTGTDIVHRGRFLAVYNWDGLNAVPYEFSGTIRDAFSGRVVFQGSGTAQLPMGNAYPQPIGHGYTPPPTKEFAVFILEDGQSTPPLPTPPAPVPPQPEPPQVCPKPTCPITFYKLTGKVTRKNGTTVIAGADITAVDKDGNQFTAKSDSQGRYSLALLGNRNYTVTVSKPGTTFTFPVAEVDLTADTALNIKATNR